MHQHDFNNEAYIIFRTLNSVLSDARKAKGSLPGEVFIINHNIRGSLEGMKALLGHPAITKELTKEIKEELKYASEDGETDTSIKKLLNFQLSHQDVPFFSEACLYELVGKEDARSILALMRGVLKDHAPELSDDV